MKKVEALDATMKSVGVSNRKEFFNQAISLLTWAIREKQKGNIIASINDNDNHIRELNMPLLDEAWELSRNIQSSDFKIEG